MTKRSRSFFFQDVGIIALSVLVAILLVKTGAFVAGMFFTSIFTTAPAVVTLFRLKTFRWITFLVGAFILASPLPDELGVGILGFSKLRFSRFVWLSFFFNFIGIYIIGNIARSL